MRFPLLKRCLSRLGVWVSPNTIHFGNGVLNYLNIGRWFADRKLEIPVRYEKREALYETVARTVNEPVRYLEFGVYQGAALRYWSQLLKHPDSMLHGFDSFIGLPEKWNVLMTKDVFDLEGKMPVFDDPRVRLFKGWFSDTLPPYLKEFTPSGQLIVHLDADLYSSTAFVLKALLPYFKRGTILIFDELFDREHELKAFSEFLDETGCRVECLGATRALTQAAFRITALPSPVKSV